MIKDKRDTKLKNYSHVYSLSRLSDPDVEIVLGITAGGDKSFLKDDIEDKDSDVQR